MAIIRGTKLADTLRGTAKADTITGLEGNDRLSGLGGNDTNLDGGLGNDMLDGGTGRDRMKGGKGNDTYIVDNAGDRVIELAGQGTDTVKSKVSFTLGAHVEKLTLTGTAIINGTGNTLANTITGNAKGNVLDGKAGADRMSGGLGNDTYVVDHVFDLAIEAVNQGTDTVLSSVTYTIGLHVENLTLTGTGDLNGTGNVLANVIRGTAGVNALSGGDGNDTLIGGAGADQLDGGTGTGDLASYETSTAAVFAALGGFSPANNLGTVFGSPNGDATGDTYAGVENLRGTNNTTANYVTELIAFQDLLVGDANANTLEGLDGNDLLMGKGAGDVLRGGNGIDIAVYFDTPLGGVEAHLSDASLNGTIINPSESIGDTYSSIEGLAGTYSIDLLYGDAGNNWIWGMLGDDFLFGDDGDDVLTADTGFGVASHNANINTLDGGIGSDTANYSHALYFGTVVNLVTGVVTKGINPFNDTLVDIENVLMCSISGMRVVANSAANRLEGGAGVDTVDYSASTAGVTVNLGAGTASGGFATDDTLIAIENLIGSAQTDTLTGNAGVNILDGGGGADVLNGGGGIDTFKFNAAGSGLGAGRDIVQDFKFGGVGDLDRIDLTAFGSLTFIGAANFSGDGLGEIRYDNTTTPGITVIQIDTINGDSTHDKEIELQAAYSLTSADFIFA